MFPWSYLQYERECSMTLTNSRPGCECVVTGKLEIPHEQTSAHVVSFTALVLQDIRSKKLEHKVYGNQVKFVPDLIDEIISFVLLP